MIVIMQEGASEVEISQVVEKLIALGFDPYRSTGAHLSIIAGIGTRSVDVRELEMLEGVREVVRISTPYRLASRSYKHEDSLISVGEDRVCKIGSGYLSVLAGPPVVESETYLELICGLVRMFGTGLLRSRASLHIGDRSAGMGEEGWRLLRKYADMFWLHTVSEVTDLSELAAAERYLDIVEVSTQHYGLLKEVGRLGKPVILHRAAEATIEQTLMSAEYILSGGNDKVIICDRAVRAPGSSGNTLDIDSILALKRLSHLPVAVDASLLAGRRDRVKAYATAAVAAGVDAVMVDIHPKPSEVLLEGPRSLESEQFQELMKRLRALAEVLNRKV